MELLIESALLPEARLSELLQESNEIVGMTVSSIGFRSAIEVLHSIGNQNLY